MNEENNWIVDTLIAQRGLHDKLIPENSLAAFAKAIENGYAIELDVQLLSDGTVVVFNDETLSRLTGNDGYIKFLKKSDLAMLTLLGSEEKIPTLEEVLKLVNNKVPLYINIKNSDKVGQLEASVLELVKDYDGKLVVMSFNPYVLNYFYKHAPQILRCQFGGYLKNLKMKFIERYTYKKMPLNDKVSHPDIIAYEAKKLPSRFTRKYKKMPLLAWTVKTQDEYLKVVKYCDNVIFEGFEPKI